MCPRSLNYIHICISFIKLKILYITVFEIHAFSTLLIHFIRSLFLTIKVVQYRYIYVGLQKRNKSFHGMVQNFFEISVKVQQKSNLA